MGGDQPQESIFEKIIPVLDAYQLCKLKLQQLRQSGNRVPAMEQELKASIKFHAQEIGKIISQDAEAPEHVRQYFASNPDQIVKYRESGSYSFWHIQASGHYKTVCRTKFNHRNKKLKKAWFRIKLFFYKATHDTDHKPPKTSN